MIRRLLTVLSRALPAALTLLALSAAAAAGQNLLANSSFEIGIDHRYAMGRWYMNGLPSFSLDDTTKVHGAVSLRAPFSVKGFRPSGPYGVELRAGAPVKVEKGKTYTFSVSLKTDVVETRAALEISPLRPYEHRGRAIKREKISLGRQFTPQGASYPWRRYDISFTAKESGDVYWVVDVSSDKRGTLWADALQFEEGSSATSYAPRLDMEIGLADGALGHIHDAGAPVRVDLRAFNDGAAEKSRRARLRILNDAGAVVSDRTLDIAAPAKGGASRPITLDVGQAHGVFMAELTLPDSPGYLQDTSFSVLPKPRKIASGESAFGAYATPSEEALKILARAGFHWTATLTSAESMANWGDVEGTRDRYAWRDGDVDLFRRYGFEILMNLEGWHYPNWAKALTREEKTKAFARYVEAIVGHYRGKVRYFTFADELHNKIPGNQMLGKREATWSNPQEYAAWHSVAQAAAKRANPDMQVVLNTQPGAFGPDQLFRYLSPKTVDVLAGNYYPYPNEVRTLKKSADRAGIRRFWAPGVAINTWPIYFRSERPMNAGSARDHETLARKLIRSFANGAEVFFHYTATYVGNTNVYSVFEHDSSLETGGGQFAALAWLLDGFKSVNRLPMARASLVEAYRFDRRDGKSVFALWSRLNSQGQSLVFQQPLANVEVYDRWTTRQPAGRKDGMKTLALGDQSRFIVVPTADAEAVEQSLGLARLQAAALPRAEKVARAGRYALLTQMEERGRKQKPVQTLWHESERTGWFKLLRHDPGTGGALSVTPAGGELRYDYAWDGKAQHLFLGDLPADLWGARFWRSIERDGKVQWQSGVIDGASGPRKPVAGTESEAPPLRGLAPPAYVIEMRGNRWLTIATEGEQPNLRYPTAGAWDLFAAESDDGPRPISIRRYVHGGDPHRRHILVRFAASERPPT